MKINLTPEIQQEIYNDKKDLYTVEQTFKTIENYKKLLEKYEIKKDDEDHENNTEEDDTKKIKSSDFQFNSSIRENNLNTKISTNDFMNTLTKSKKE